LAVALLSASQCVFGSVFAVINQTSPVSGSSVWRPIPDPTNPGKFIPSYFRPAGRTEHVLAIPCTGTGTRTATFFASGLQSGYYKVELFYPKHVGNAKKIRWQHKATQDAAFQSSPRTINQQIGIPTDSLDASQINVVPNSFQSAYQNLTPFNTSNAASYIWVDGNNLTGKLWIRLTDAGCGTPSAPGGRMVADGVRLTLISPIK
jgi:hypothetical protein